MTLFFQHFATAIFSLFFAVFSPAPAAGGGLDTITQLSPWTQTATTVRLSSTTAKLRIPGLTNCDTIDTDGSGVFTCGTDATGGGGLSGLFTGMLVAPINSTTLGPTSTPTVAAILATSTTATSSYSGPFNMFVVPNTAQPTLYVGTSTTHCPVYGCIEGDLVVAEKHWNGTTFFELVNGGTGSCASTLYSADGNIPALNSNFSGIGFTNTGWTGVGCAFGNGKESALDGVLALPTGNWDFESGNGAFKFWTGTNQSETITSNGNFGIATTTPGSALSVQGNQFIAGNITSTSTKANIFPYASSTSLTAGNLFASSFSLSGVSDGCATFTSNVLSSTGIACGSGGSSFAYPWTFNLLNTFSTSTNSTSTSYWTKGVFFSSSTVAASQFPYASSTALTAGSLFATDATTTSLAITNAVSSLLLTNSSGGVGKYGGASNPCTNQFPTTISALGVLGGCTSVADAFFTGQLAINHGGTNNTTFGTTGGLIFYDGSKLTQSAGGDPFYDQGNDRFGIANATPQYRIESTGSNGSGYFALSSGSSKHGDVFTVDSNGNVGIATTTPGAKLGIQGNAFIAGNIVSTSTVASIFPYASTTVVSASIASSSLLFVNGLGGCIAGQYLTWSAGSFGCATDSVGSAAPEFTVTLLNSFNTTTLATTSSIWTKGIYIASSTVAASQFPYASTTALSAATALYVGNDSKQTFETMSFSFSSSTQGSGTTTKFLGPAAQNLTMDSAQCDSNRFLNIGISNAAGTYADYFMASGTIGTFNFSTNNTFTAGQAMRVDIGTTTNLGINTNTATSSLGCRIKYHYTI